MATTHARQLPKNPMSAAYKVTRVVTEFFLPLTEGFVPRYTPLTPTPDADELQLLERIWELFPESIKSRETFVAKMGELYDSLRAPPGEEEPSAKRQKSEQPDP